MNGVALANLNINVTANTGPVTNNMNDIKNITHVKMKESGDAVKTFQQGFTAASAQMQGDAQRFKADVNASAEKVKEFAASRVAIAAVGIAMGTMAAAVAAAGYTAYKASGFITGLFTGSTYKSENINALIAMNKEVVDLQRSLQLAAQDATAMNDALTRTGADKGDFKSVYEKTEEAIRNNGTELDRLGVKYKDINGKMLDTRTIVENAKAKLDEYTDGWDRNKAAVAIGMGSYLQLNNYLKINQKEVDSSKQRLAEYGLLIGPETQKFVDDYQQSMREFNNETKLMGDGFKRVWADQVMPIFTTWATSFKEGWPSIVNGTRHLVAAFTSLGYGLKMSFDIIYDVIEGIFKIVGGGFASLAAAGEAVLTGNIAGAKDILIQGWEDVKKSVAGIGSQIEGDATKNLKAMQLAQGLLNKSNLPAGMPGSWKDRGGKTWVAPPAKTEETDDGWSKELHRMKKQLIEADPYLTNYDKKIKEISESVRSATERFPDHAAEIKKWGEEMKFATETADILSDTIKEIEADLKTPAVDREIIGLRFDDAARIRNATYSNKEMALATKMTTGGATQQDELKLQYEKAVETKEAELQKMRDLNQTQTDDYRLALEARALLDRQYAANRNKMTTETYKEAGGIVAGQLGQLAGMMDKSNRKQFDQWKALAIGQATISTALAVAGILGAESKLGMFAIPLAVSAGAIGLAQIAKIAATPYQAREKGGPVSAGQSYIVGEKRPELFTPGASGFITPYVPGGKGVEHTTVFQITTGVAETVQAEIMRLAPALTQMSVNAVRDAINGGGEMAMAVGRM